MESSCIKLLDLSGGITTTELKRFPCLESSVTKLEDIPLNVNLPDFVNTDKLILVLFKAVQQLQTEIDTLKAN